MTESQGGPADSQASLGVGRGSTTPNRPKKRLPSTKKKGGAVASPPDDIPPVPGMPASSPAASLSMSLASPIHTNYTYPAQHHAHDYGHAHSHAHGPNPGQPGFFPPEYSAYGYPGHHGYMNPAGLQSPFPPPHHAPHSSPGHGRAM